MVAKVIEAATDERETISGEVLDVGREIQFAVEPWFDGVLIGGDDVHEVPGLERADVAGDGLVEQFIAPGNAGRSQQEDEERNGRGAEGDIFPEPGEVQRGGTDFGVGFTGHLADVVAQRCGGGMAERGFPQRDGEGADGFFLGGAGGTGFQMAHDFQAVGGIEFAIDMGVEERAEVSAVHAAPFWLSAADNWRRARARRDMTVPTGTAATSAISL